MADATADAREDRFLANRQQREQERAAARDEAAAEELEKRARFNTAVAEFAPRVAALLSDGGDVDAAMEAWREMQGRVANAVQTVRLTAHDVRSANATLARVFNDIERRRSERLADGGTTRFRFSRGVRPVGSSFRTDQGADVIGKEADACVADDGPANAVSDVTGGTHTMVEASTARFIRRCTDATIVLGPVGGSCFLSECRGCKVYVACHQMRINKCVDCEIYVWCRSTPVIERSENIRFGGYEAWRGALAVLQARDGASALATLDDYVRAAGISDVEQARAAHRHVADFTWLKQQASPNWTALPEAQWAVRE